MVLLPPWTRAPFLPFRQPVGTLVVRYLYGKVADQPDDVTVLAIDPDTFPKTAFWDRRFAADSLDSLMAKLRAPAPAGTVPAVAVVEDGPDFPPTFQLRLGTTRVQVVVVARVLRLT